MEKRKLVHVHVPDYHVQCLDDLVKRGIYPNRTIAVTDAIFCLIKEELHIALEHGQERRSWSNDYQ